mgnify:CR=1 FL=1
MHIHSSTLITQNLYTHNTKKIADKFIMQTILLEGGLKSIKKCAKKIPQLRSEKIFSVTKLFLLAEDNSTSCRNVKFEPFFAVLFIERIKICKMRNAVISKTISAEVF